MSIAPCKYVLEPEVRVSLVPKCTIALGTHPASKSLISGVRILLGGVVSTRFRKNTQLLEEISFTESIMEKIISVHRLIIK